MLIYSNQLENYASTANFFLPKHTIVSATIKKKNNGGKISCKSSKICKKTEVESLGTLPPL